MPTWFGRSRRLIRWHESNRAHYASESLLSEFDEAVYDQITNVATLPGVFKHTFAAMECTINISFANRQMILHRIREVFSSTFGRSAADLGLHMVYDFAHHTAKLERYEMDGAEKPLLVHRKGATRALGPGAAGLAAMPWEFLDDAATADIAFRAWAENVEHAFIEAGEDLMNVMVEELDAIAGREQRCVHLENEELDLLLFEFLESIIYYKDAENLLLRARQVKIAQEVKCSLFSR